MKAVYMWRKVHQTVLSYSQIEKFIDDDLKKGLDKSNESRRNGKIDDDDWDKVQVTVRASEYYAFLFLYKHTFVLNKEIIIQLNYSFSYKSTVYLLWNQKLYRMGVKCTKVMHQHWNETSAFKWNAFLVAGNTELKSISVWAI